MKTPRIRIGGSALAGLVSFLLSVTAVFGAPSEAPVSIYDKQAGLASGWTALTWGGVHVEPVRTISREGGAGSLLVAPAAGAAPYAGMHLVAGVSGGVELDEQLRKEGVVQLWLRNGNDSAGQPAFDQELQVMLSFAPAGGKALNGAYERVVLSPTPTDGAPGSGWQLVTMSIPGMLKNRVDAATPVRLRGVYLQYIDQPQAGLHIGECVVRRSAK